MKFLYDIFFLVFSIFYLPYLLVKGKWHKDFLQKFAFLPNEITKLKNPLWIHSVSVGESMLAVKLANRLKRKFPEISVVVSTTTKTGNDIIQKKGKGVVDAVFYYPADLSFVVSKVIRLIKPCLYIMVETELWPNLLEELNSKKIPAILVNGRMSNKSFSNYKKVTFIVKRMLKGISSFCMQSKEDANRVEQLGAEKSRIIITGNMKFDEPMKKGATITREVLGFEEDDQILVAGSTHSPEEEKIIEVFRKIKKHKPGFKLVLAPRHIERKDSIETVILKSGLKCICLSDVLSADKKKIEKDCEVLLVDTIGHLSDIYNVATMVFIGGSFAKRGGGKIL